MGVNDWSRNPDENGLVDPAINATDGAPARDYQRGLRGIMAAAKKLNDDQSGGIVSAGFADTYTVRTFSGLTSLRAGVALSFVPDRDSGGPASLVVDGLGALPLLDRNGVDITEGFLREGRTVRVVYDAVAVAWRVTDLGLVSNSDLAPSPANTIKGNNGSGVADLAVSAARALLQVDHVANKTEEEMVASGAISAALATKATPANITAALAPVIADVATKATPQSVADALAPVITNVSSLQTTVAPLPGRLTLVEQSQQGNRILKATYAELAALTATVNAGAEVLDSDTGTHTDPVVGGTVPNSGTYSYSTSPAGWKRVGITTAAAVAASTATGLAPVVRATSIYRPGDVLSSWTTQVSAPEATATPLSEGGQYAVVDGADGRVLQITPSASVGVGPIHCDAIYPDKTYEYPLVDQRLIDGASSTVLLRLYGFTAANVAVGPVTILTQALTVADLLQKPSVRLTGAAILALLPGAVKARPYIALTPTNGRINISSLAPSTVVDLASSIATAPSNPAPAADAQIPFRDPTTNALQQISYAALAGTSSAAIASLTNTVGTKASRYAPPSLSVRVRPSIKGTVAAGQVLMLDTGEWSATPSFSIQWLSNGSPIAGAAGLTFAVTSAEVGTTITAVVEAQTAVAQLSIVAKLLLPMPSSVASLIGFGDSITFGQGASTDANQFLNLVATALGAGTPLNAGRSGTVLQNSPDATGSPKANNGRDRYVADTTGSNKREMIISAYGFNGARYIANPSEFNVTAFLNDYREVVSGWLAAGYTRDRVVIVTPHWIQDAGLLEGSPGFYGQSRAGFELFVAASRRIASEFGLYWADSYSALRDGGGASLITSDKIHPNNAGHQVIANAVLAATKFADPEPLTTPYTLDYFTGDDGQLILLHKPEVGLGWETQPGALSTAIDAQITSNRLFNPATNAIYRNLTAPPSADYYVEADLLLLSTDTANVGLTGRANIGASTFYFVNYSRSTGLFGLFKTIGGSGTTSLGTYADPFTSGSRTMRLSMSGTNISVQVNGQTVIGVVDTDITTAGFGGLRYGAAGSKNGGIHLTRYEMGVVKLVVDDPLSGADGTNISTYTSPVGGGYVAQTGFAPASPPVFIGGRIRATAGSGLYRNTVGPSVRDYAVEGTFDWIGARSGDDVGVIGRASADAETLYFARYKPADGAWSLWRDVAGTQLRLGAFYTDAFDSGSRVCRLVMKGSVISLQIDGVTVISVQDSAIPGPGFGGFRLAATQTDTTGRHLTRLTVSAL